MIVPRETDGAWRMVKLSLVDLRVIGGDGVRDCGGLKSPTPARFAPPGVVKYSCGRSSMIEGVGMERSEGRFERDCFDKSLSDMEDRYSGALDEAGWACSMPRVRTIA